jgi:hypothetical protein
MKKNFHLGMFAIIVVITSSCTKSGSDLVANEAQSKSKISNSSKMHHINLGSGNLNSGPIISSQLSKFYPFINQPEPMELGDNGAAISSGQVAVFYVVLSPDVANQTPVNATLNTIDDATGQIIESYKLISYNDVAGVDAIVPDELAGTPFMVALVHLSDQYIDKTITLTSDIEFPNAYSPARLERAFTVVQ